MHSDEGIALCHALHQYVYNFGESPVRFNWSKGCSKVLNPGDSAYIRPMLTHNFSRINHYINDRSPRLVVIRVPGDLIHEAIDEYAGFNPKGRQRVIQETNQWF